MFFKACSDCGELIRSRYTRCYDCHRRRQRSSWHDPEFLVGQAERDAELGYNEFYVYVLHTDYGHYVGHTANVRSRLAAHKANKVQSTAGGNPELLWTSYPLDSRKEATQFEAALKSLRDRSAERFQEITGYEPIPFEWVPAKGRGCGLLGVVSIVVVAAVVVFILTIF